MKPTKLKLPVGYTGKFYSVEVAYSAQKETRLNSDLDTEGSLAKQVIEFIKSKNAVLNDVVEFFDAIKALLPEGFIIGNGAHHIWIHRIGYKPLQKSFGVWIRHDFQLYVKMKEMEERAQRYFDATNWENNRQLAEKYQNYQQEFTALFGKPAPVKRHCPA
jgi:hypothetical protein